jgi:hypothetical protein
MTSFVNMRARLVFPLLVCLGASCGKGLPEGATSVYLTIQNGVGLGVPDQLQVSAFGDGTPVYTAEPLPRSGAQIGGGPDGLLGTVTIYVPAGVAELRTVVSAYTNQIKRAEGSVTVRVVSGRQVSARAVLQPFSDSTDGSTDAGAAPDAGSGGDTQPDDVADGGTGGTGGTSGTPDGSTDVTAPPDGGSPDSLNCASSSLSGVSATPTGNIDLTAEGTVDWRLWGAPPMVSYKRTAGDKISDYTMIGSGPVSTHFRSGVTFSWSDGSPTLVVTGAENLLNLGTVGSGAAITAAAATTARTLSVYVGGSNDTGLFEATLSDGCVTGYSASATNSREYYVVYRVTFKSAVPGTVLRVRWTMTAGFEAIGLFAATLN